MSNEIANGFLLICDKQLEDKAMQLATMIRTTSGKIVIKTMENVQEAKGKTFGDKLDKVLNTYAHAVIIVCSQTFADFIDKKSKDNCPDIILQNHKDCARVLKELIKNEAKRSPHKLILVQLDGALPVLPKALKGMRIIKDEGNKDAFINQIIAEITGKFNR